MQIIDTNTLPLKRQVKVLKNEITGYQKLINQRNEWLAVIENRDKPNYRAVAQSRDQLLMNLEEAKYELYQLGQA